MLLELLLPLVLLANGLAAGVLVGTQLGGWPLLVSLPPDRYVRTHAFFSSRFDPFMPVCLLVSTLGGLALGLLAPSRTARVLYLAAAVCCAVTVVISLVKNVPVNTWLRSLDPADLPDDFGAHDPRREWGFWNLVRTGLCCFAFGLECLTLVPPP